MSTGWVHGKKSERAGVTSKREPTRPHPSILRAFRRALIQWYQENGRKFPWRNKTATHYQLILAEVLLQRTRAETVAVFFREFVAAFRSWKKLGEASERDLQRFLKPIGLWRRRAASLKRLAVEMGKRGGRFPRSCDAIEALPGVGQYVANAIHLFCHGQPRPLIDVNMARVLERYFGPRLLADIRYDPYLQSLASKLVCCGDPISINWAILDFAALVCTLRSPRCANCRLASQCTYAGRPSLLDRPGK